MKDSIIEVKNISKKYKIGSNQPYYALRDVITGLFKTPINIFKFKQTTKNNSSDNEFWALKDISFQINQGETIGIIGPNGAGKSTLLKILSRITPPTSGEIRLRGRVASLLEVGTGFHPELTGRENIFLNGSILGMKRWEIKKKFNEIVEFAEIEKFLDTPVKHYSSGMYMRLAFSVAAHLEPEILLVDEVLAVGDANFQKKSLGKMEEVTKKEGRTILFVSHNMGAVTRLCNKSLLLDKGKIVMFGSTVDVVQAYTTNNSSLEKSVYVGNNFSGKLCYITTARVSDKNNKNTNTFDIGEEIFLYMKYQVKKRLIYLQMTVTILKNDLSIVHTFDTDKDKSIRPKASGLYEACYKIPKMFLKAGVYSINLTSGTPDKLIESLENVLTFTVEELYDDTQFKGYKKERSGIIISPGIWETTKVK